MTGPWTPARGKEFSTLSGESWPGGAGADTRPTLLSTTTTTFYNFADGAGGTRLTLLAPQEGARHIRSRAGHRSGAPGSPGPAPPAKLDTGCFELSHMGNGFAASVARCREYRAAPQLNASGLLDHTLIA